MDACNEWRVIGTLHNKAVCGRECHAFVNRSEYWCEIKFSEHGGIIRVEKSDLQDAWDFIKSKYFDDTQVE